MKKFIIAALAAALPVAAMASAPATTPAPATTAAAPAPMMMKSEVKTETTTIKPAEAVKMQMEDGSWAQVEADGSVKVSKDGGKTWMPAPDGSWKMKDGSIVVTKGGKKA